MSTDLRPTGRLSLTPSQRAVADELFAALTGEELVTLAQELPYAAVAATALWGSNSLTVDAFNFDKVVSRSAAADDRRYLVAAYCACAGQNGMAKLLSEMLELSKRRLALVNKLGGLVRMAADLKLPLFLAAFAPKDDEPEEKPDGDVQDGGRVGE
jgi:hypothetical protein